jgi:Ala-tRNA(Pro) deacylase
MAINPEVKNYLDEKQVVYEAVAHPQVFSTIEEAQTLGIEADEIAKTLVVHASRMPGDRALVVVPGSRKISNDKIREVFGSKHARLSLEDELEQEFPQFELGAVPPLGELLNLPVYVDERLLGHDTILFSGGTHTDSVKMDVNDFFGLCDSILVDVAEEEKAA